MGIVNETTNIPFLLTYAEKVGSAKLLILVFALNIDEAVQSVVRARPNADPFSFQNETYAVCGKNKRFDPVYEAIDSLP